MRLSVTNNYKDSSQAYNLKPDEVRPFFAEHFPWIDSTVSLKEMIDEVNESQAYEIEVADDVQKAEQETSGDVAQDMLGVDANKDKIFQAAFWLAGKSYDAAKARQALWQEDGDVERAALVAAGLDVEDDTLRALRAVLELGGDLKKSGGPEKGPGPIKEHDFAVEPPKSVEPGTPEAVRVVGAVQKAFKAGTFRPVNLGGKHSTNSILAKDPDTGAQYLLKPASGGVGPAAGVKEESASQARREAAFSHIAADVFGLGNFVPDAELLLLDGKEWCAISMLPFSWKNLDKAKKVDYQRVARTLNELRAQGVLHRWAVLDYVAGQPDRHFGNLMISPDDHIKLIDAGSAFAASGFDPGNDKSSFIPAYLRYTVNSTQNFNNMDPAAQLGHMPILPESGDRELSLWIQGLDEKRLESSLRRSGISDVGIRACLARLELIQNLDYQKAVAPQVNALWLAT